MIATERFPAGASVLLNGIQSHRAWMRWAFGQWRPRHRPGARRNQGGHPALQQRWMADLRIVSPIGGHDGDGCLGRQLSQQIRQYLGIPHESHSQFSGDDLVGVRIHGRMPLAPSPTPTRSVLAHRSFAFVVDLQTGGVDHHMPGFRTHAASDPHRPFWRPSAERAVVRGVERVTRNSASSERSKPSKARNGQ